MVSLHSHISYQQLFKRPHPQKRVVGRRPESGVVVPTSNYSVSSDAFFFTNPDCLSPNMAPIKGKILSVWSQYC